MTAGKDVKITYKSSHWKILLTGLLSILDNSIALSDSEGSMKGAVPHESAFSSGVSSSS